MCLTSGWCADADQEWQELHPPSSSPEEEHLEQDAGGISNLASAMLPCCLWQAVAYVLLVYRVNMSGIQANLLYIRHSSD